MQSITLFAQKERLIRAANGFAAIFEEQLLSLAQNGLQVHLGHQPVDRQNKTKETKEEEYKE